MVAVTHPEVIRAAIVASRGQAWTIRSTSTLRG